MELLQLKKFCHAARTGNFTQTAKAFGVPPSDISQTVRRLEQELGTPLFTRRANAVALNERGTEFARRAQEALALLEDAAAAARDDDRRGAVRLCVNTNRRIVMDTVEAFSRLYPEVDITARVSADPTADTFDLIVSAQDERLASFRREKLLSEQLAVAVSLRSPWADAARLADLAEAPFITMNEGSSLYRLTHRLCREAGFAPRVAVQSDDPYYVRKCVELGLGAAVVPLFSWQGQFAGGIALHPLDCRRDTYLYTAPDRYLPRCARSFARMLAQRCAQMAGEALTTNR